METEDSDEAQAILMARYNPGSVFSSSEITRLYRDPSLTTNMDRKQLHKILKNPGMFPEAENELKILLRRNRATGGRVGLYAGTDPEDYPEEEEDLTLWELQQEEGVPIGPMAGMGNVMKLFETPYGFDRGAFEEMIINFQEDNRGMKLHEFAEQWLGMVKKDTPKAPIQMAAQGGRVGANIGGIMGGRVGLKVLKDYFEEEEEYAQGGRIGYGKGGDIMKGIKMGLSPDQALNAWKAWKKLKDEVGITSSFSDYLYGETSGSFAQGGRIGAFGGGVMGIGTPGMRLPGIPQMAPDGLEYNMKAGGFQNLGAQEGKDDVNAKLAKNEFVMTADAVRGAGDGNIEVGAQKMYDTMKRLEGKVA